jgi:hypothetical protein
MNSPPINIAVASRQPACRKKRNRWPAGIPRRPHSELQSETAARQLRRLGLNAVPRLASDNHFWCGLLSRATREDTPIARKR